MRHSLIAVKMNTAKLRKPYVSPTDGNVVAFVLLSSVRHSPIALEMHLANLKLREPYVSPTDGDILAFGLLCASTRPSTLDWA